MMTLAEIRAKLQAQEDSKSNQGSYRSNEPNSFLAHWLIPDGTPLNLRFLPDADDSNQFFWREREMINLWFNGIKGGEQKRVKVVVPCNEMFEGQPINSCPVLKEVREWYKAGDPALEERAREYWKKKSYLFQCFVAPKSAEVENDIQPENPIRRVMLNKNLFNKVKSILLNPQVEYLPTEYEHGRDFSIIKGKQGQFANYDQSQWGFAERPLNDDELNAIEKFGLFNLNDFMPKQPSEAELNAIAEMFEASVNEEQYDPERWAQFYRPAGVQAPNKSQSVAPPAQSQPADTPADSDVPAQVDTPAPSEQPAPAAEESKPQSTASATKTSTSDLLAKLKAAQNK